MPGTGLLDTSVYIDLTRIDSALLPEEPSFSTVSMAELGLGVHAARHDPVEHMIRSERLRDAELGFRPLPFDNEAARAYTRLVGLVYASGRNPRPRRIDLMIAAVAAANSLRLFTRNADDFRGLGTLVDVIAV
jgi:toxin FitB